MKHIRKPKLIFAAMAFLLMFSSYIFFTYPDLTGEIFQKYFAFLLPLNKEDNTALSNCENTKTLLERKLCIRNAMARLTDNQDGIAAAVGLFGEYAKKQGNTFACHSTAHILGETLYAKTKDVSGALVACSSSCYYGCMHGAVGALLNDKKDHDGGITPAAIKEMHLAETCRNYSRSNKSPGAFLVCVHGLGHAFMLLEEGDILRALHNCDLMGFESETTNRMCWTGVFMENTSNVFLRHINAYFSKNDPFYPCSMGGLDEKYIQSCYNQLYFLGWKEAFDICGQAPAKWIASCAEGIGIYIASLVPDDIGRIVDRCAAGEPDLMAPCLKGAGHYIWVGAGSDFKNDPRVKEFCEKSKLEDNEICGGSDI